MTYTALVLVVVVAVLCIDRWAYRTRLVGQVSFWLAYAVIAFFQLLTNGVLTGLEVVRYNPEVVIGSGTDGSPVPFIGDGRIAFAPIEDLGFGFAFVLLVLSTWSWLGRIGLQPEPKSGPPIWRR
jgi:lycopene cyclase domain-containing protein